MWERWENVYEVMILCVCIETWAYLAIVEMAVAVDGNGVFLKQSYEEGA